MSLDTCGTCPDRNISTACPSIASTMLTLYAACYDNVTTVTYDTADEYVSGMSGATASGFTSGFFVELAVPFEGSFFDVIGATNKNNNSYSFNPTVTFKLASLDPDIILLYESFVKSKVVVVVKLIGPRYFALGLENGLLAETANITSSTTADDFAGATIMLSSFGETRSVRELDTAMVANFAALIATV